ncbi:MAG: deaminase [Patescibacteria group bacterium]|nr:deaminase [Patescibacteria group bacterium]
MKKILIAYIPILHSGYLKLLNQEKFFEIHIMQEDLIKDIGIDYIVRKDLIRSLSPDLIVAALKSWEFKDVYSLNLANAKSILYQEFKETLLVLPDEDISRDFADKYLPGKEVKFSSIFLRWHRNNVEEEKSVQVDQTIFSGEVEQLMMRFAFVEGKRSADWWRQVGGILRKDDAIILAAHNTHVPDPQMPYVFGDPRAIFKKGIHIELSTADHAEAILIAEAARRGISLEGTELFVTDFPCPPCAKLIARSGIKKVFFLKGYAVLDGENILKDKGVELIQISP